MPATDYQGSSAPFAYLGRSLLSLRRDPIQPMDGHHHHDTTGGGSSSSSSHDYELESFQRHVADLFQGLASSEGEELLSLLWIRKLLDTFLICQEEFRAIIVCNARVALSRPPLDRLITEFLDRAVKALDVCNAIRDGLDQVRRLEKHLEIVLTALSPSQRTLGEGQLRRAKKALAEFTIAMLDEKDIAGSILTHRNRSFGRNSNSGKDNHHRQASLFRSLSWSVSRSWSAARQLQAISNNLTAPRNNEIVATNGLAVPIFTMNSVLLFVMWALVAAIPCQDRGIQTHLSIPRNFMWASPISSLYDRIMDESKKKDRKNSNGLLKEIHQIEKCVRHLTELTDAIQFPMVEEREAEVRQRVKELADVCDVVKDRLDPLERQVREVFRRIVRSRTEGLESLGSSSHS